jgi:hypothetical protein
VAILSQSSKGKERKWKATKTTEGELSPLFGTGSSHIYTKYLTVGIITSYSFHNQHIERDRTIPSAFTLKTKHTVAL